jgi:hypothetical protein
MGVKPGHAHLPSIKFLYLDYFLAPIKLVPRHCASAHLPASCNRDSFPATYQTCTATRVMLNKICTRTAKTRAIPSLHRDNFSAKVPGPCPVLASGNTTFLYCRAVICKVLDTRQLDWHDIHPTYNSIRVRISINVPGLPTHKQEFGSRHRDSLRCCQTHVFLPSRT